MVTKETDFYTLTKSDLLSKDARVSFKYPEGSAVYEQQGYDWYMTVALEKADKVTADRHLLTRDLILHYRWAIREGYGHQLDPALRNPYDYPRNRNTIKGIQDYINRIVKASDNEGKV